MDQDHQMLKRLYQQNPGCPDTAGRYIASLERTAGTGSDKLPKRRGWACPDPDPISFDGARFCVKHEQWERCKPTPDDPCDFTHIGPAGLPGSPDGVCVYPGSVYAVNGEHYQVDLIINGVMVSYPVPAESKDAYWECCIFCGEPEERK